MSSFTQRFNLERRAQKFKDSLVHVAHEDNEEVDHTCTQCGRDAGKSTRQYRRNQMSGTPIICKDCKSLNSVQVCSTPFCSAPVRSPSRGQTDTEGKPVRVCEVCNYLKSKGVDLTGFGDAPEAVSDLFYGLEDHGHHTVPGMLTKNGDDLNIALPSSIFSRLHERNIRKDYAKKN